MTSKKQNRTKLYKEIERDLKDQLDRNGTVGKYYLDLVNDYMRLWGTKNMLLEDIEARGVTVEYNNGGGQSGVKKNDSIDQVLKVNAQMLKLLDSLGIKPSPAEGEDDDEM